ncbi:RNA 2',3'-cyclic phosphodiesterase [Marinobacter salarius]|uniref:RNA 2',3'-cyclic phosphodiesterase n=1 Tax=Marinobacter salarius TaxID=1420917 RepID=UPI0009E2DBE2|nr:RNA 2',3'-cyclic phosphodiesterase [Marinobacter salarius]
MDKPETHRLFFGLEIPDSVKQRLVSIQQPVAGARWQLPDQLHLTLVFLGSVARQRLPDVCDAARNLPVGQFDLTVCGLGCFGRPDFPKYLWAGVQPADKLAELHEVLNQNLCMPGFEQEKRPFCPHITLARFKRQRGSVVELLESQERQPIGTFSVGGIALFESTQGAHGSVYQIIERFPLAGNPERLCR